MDNNSLTLSSLRLEHCSSLLTVAWVRGTLPVTPPWSQQGSGEPNITDWLHLVIEGDVQGCEGWKRVSTENGVEEGVCEEAAEIPLQVQNLQLLGRDQDGPEIKKVTLGPDIHF